MMDASTKEGHKHAWGPVDGAVLPGAEGEYQCDCGAITWGGLPNEQHEECVMGASTKAAVLVDAGLAENLVDAVCQLVDMGEIGVEEAEVTLAGVDDDPFLAMRDA